MAPISVLIHFGFPKTGSTSLQHGLFKELHNSGRINLCTWRQHDSVEPLLDRASSRLFCGLPMLDKSISFRPGVLNVLSDESFTAPHKLRKENFGDDIADAYSFPSRIKEQILQKYGGDVEFSCLAIARNQPDLLYSQYVEEHNLKRLKNIDLLFDESHRLDLKGFEVYRFHQYYSRLVEVFGEKAVSFLLFEDWLAGCTNFFGAIAQVLRVDAAYVRATLIKSHLNKRVKSSSGYFAKVGGPPIPYFSDEERRIIREFFREDSLQFQALLGKTRNLVALGYL